MIKKCIKTSARFYFHDRSEENKGTKNDIFLAVKYCIWNNLKTSSVVVCIFYTNCP